MALSIEHVSGQGFLIGREEEEREPQALSINLLRPIQLYPPLDPSIAQTKGTPEQPVEHNLSNDQGTNRQISRNIGAKTHLLESNLDTNSNDSPISDLDELEFLVSIPRRKKKKRKSHQNHDQDQRSFVVDPAVRADHTLSKNRADCNTTGTEYHSLSSKNGHISSPSNMGLDDSTRRSHLAKNILHSTSGTKDMFDLSRLPPQTLRGCLSKSPAEQLSGKLVLNSGTLTKKSLPRKRKHIEDNSSTVHRYSFAAQKSNRSGLQHDCSAQVFPMQHQVYQQPESRVTGHSSGTSKSSSVNYSDNSPLIPTSPAYHGTNMTVTGPRVTSRSAPPVSSQRISLPPPKARVTNISSVRPPSENELRRRPSLYGVPQWTLSSLESSKITNKNPGGFRPCPTGSGRHENLREMQRTLTHSATPQNITRQPSMSPNQIQFLADGNVSELENLEQPHAQNMLVDIAQTCQATFPFAMIAKRHKQPIQKVFDTFSAVIQLPLLRSAVDNRRAGKLGTDRMKDFRATKKDVLEQNKQERRDAKKMARAK